MANPATIVPSTPAPAAAAAAAGAEPAAPQKSWGARFVDSYNRCVQSVSDQNNKMTVNNETDSTIAKVVKVVGFIFSWILPRIVFAAAAFLVETANSAVSSLVALVKSDKKKEEKSSAAPAETQPVGTEGTPKQATVKA